MTSGRGSYTALRDSGSGHRESLVGEPHGLRESMSSEPLEEPCLEFIEGDRFQMTIGVVIFLNILVLWGETDAEGWAIWPFCDNVFLLIFITEIVLRITHFGIAEYFSGDDRLWAFLDTFVVVLGIMDLWITPLFAAISSSDKKASGHQFSVLRFLRLMRLLRLLRVFKMFSDLRRFASALVAMGREFRWIFAVLSLFIFCTAITLTHLLGHGEALGSYDYLTQEHAEAFELIQRHWGDVGKSLFTLFQVTTIDNWDMIAIPIVSIARANAPWWRIFFAFFIMFASWIMISVLTAVASNSMIEATSDRKEKEQEELEHKSLMFIEFLREVFNDADTDGNGVLDREEFSALMEKDFVHKKMRSLGIHFTEDELFKAWEMLDIDESGELTIDEFVTGLSSLQEGLATKHIVNVEYSMKKVHAQLDKRLQQCRGEVNELLEQTQIINAKLTARTDAQHQQQLSFWLWQQWAAKNENLEPPPPPEPEVPPKMTKSMRTFSARNTLDWAQQGTTRSSDNL